MEVEEEKLQKEIDRLQREKRAILEEMSMHSSKDYEENMLQRVYEQRHKK